MVEFILLIGLSIIIARMLERKYKVASAFHAVLFIVQSVILLFSTDVSFIKQAMVTIVGKDAYTVIHQIIRTSSIYVNGGTGVLLIIDLSIFVLLPLLSIVVFVDRIKDLFKEIKVKNRIKIIVNYLINLVLNPTKDFKHNKNETYLILLQLRN